MRMLLAAGAEVDHQNSAGMTALHRAALHGCNRAARMLLNANARPELRNKAGLSCVEINSDPEMRRIVVGSQLRLAQGSRAGARGSAVRPPSELRKVRPPSSSGERRPPGDKVPAAAVGALGGSRLAEREVMLQVRKTPS
jgi:hypothetical protein